MVVEDELGNLGMRDIHIHSSSCLDYDGSNCNGIHNIIVHRPLMLHFTTVFTALEATATTCGWLT